MLISLIVALDEGGGIGKAGRLPWRLSTDLQRFKRLTLGHHIVMGRKTYESIGRLLPGRTTIIVSRNPQYLRDTELGRLLSQSEGISADQFRVVEAIENALVIARANAEDELFIIGGGEIFRLTLAIAERIYLTRVHTHLDCDTFFPEIDLSGWRIVEENFHPADVRNQYATTFQILERIQGA